nr:polysaccharide deacetylase family protein [uncultured Blautia sp.]
MKKRSAWIMAAVLAAGLAVGEIPPFPEAVDIQAAEDAASDETPAAEAQSQEETEEREASEADTGSDGSDSGENGDSDSSDTKDGTDSGSSDSGESSDSADDIQIPEPENDEVKKLLKQAEKKVVQYDYNGAIILMRNNENYPVSKALKVAVKKYRKMRDACVEYPLEEITHVFFHSLIVDTSKAFDGDSDEAGYNQMMTTVSEFNKMMQSMYDKGYVLVSPHDMAIVGEDGNMSRGKILVPEGKIPFVLSLDDCSYYHYMDGDGFASKMVVDDNGDVKCQYIEDDGSVSVGDYDVVPLLDSFVKEHPDFSWHGRKGILAMTGYNGVFGYRTDVAYKTKKNLQDDQKAFLKANPKFDYNKEVKEAKEVASALRQDGWEFASHTWGHRNATTSTAKELKKDNQKWEKYVAPILGKTDMIIFAFGADIGDWEGYSSDNAKYKYFKSRGYHYFCNVDSSQYFVQITKGYFRQGRRNLDGYRMYYNPDMLSDLFDVSEVWDSSRPTPVPEM